MPVKGTIEANKEETLGQLAAQASGSSACRRDAAGLPTPVMAFDK